MSNIMFLKLTVYLIFLSLSSIFNISKSTFFVKIELLIPFMSSAILIKVFTRPCTSKKFIKRYVSLQLAIQCESYCFSFT